jgi:hypothetical protein
LALLHYPVHDKNGDVIASAVSNLDLRELVHRIVSHWTTGVGSKYNPDRRAALSLIKVVASLGAALDDVENEGAGVPVTVVTDAKPHPNNISFKRLEEISATGRSHIILFGTAWGLTREFIEEADYVLSPIMGHTEYNHLSVRSAAAIVLDRLLGKDRN